MKIKITVENVDYVAEVLKNKERINGGRIILQAKEIWYPSDFKRFQLWSISCLNDSDNASQYKRDLRYKVFNGDDDTDVQECLLMGCFITRFGRNEGVTIAYSGWREIDNTYLGYPKHLY